MFESGLTVTVLGAALVAGIFYAFSTFVMKALARRPAAGLLLVGLLDS